MDTPKPQDTVSSSFTRAGIAGRKQPKFVLRTMWLHPGSAGTTWETQRHPTVAESKEGFATAPRVAGKHGITEEWDGMENLWSHLFFCHLKALPGQPVLMADSPSCPSTNSGKAVEVLLESFRVPALHIANTGFLTLCASGRVTGLAVEARAAVSHATSVCLGQTCREATYRLGVASGFPSSYLHSLLLESPSDPLLLRALKIQLKKQRCYVSMNYEGDLHNQANHHSARLQAPSGHWITLDKEQFCCLEPFLQPELLHQTLGLHHLAQHARTDKVGNIVLSGCSSKFPGHPERMCLELNALFHGTGCQVHVLASPERGRAAWAGGSMAALLTSFQPSWMTKVEYQECGAKHTHEKFQQQMATAHLTHPTDGAQLLRQEGP
ncbi:LOW QUALITY PROTEIN: actin-like protein 10 [Rhynochetos jubatus]